MAFAVNKCKPKQLEIDVIAVRKMWRRRGLGVAFAKHFMALALESGNETYELEALPGSVDFWKTMGFTFKKGIKKDYSKTCRWMEAKLTDIPGLAQLRGGQGAQQQTL